MDKEDKFLIKVSIAAFIFTLLYTYGVCNSIRRTYERYDRISTTNTMPPRKY